VPDSSYGIGMSNKWSDEQRRLSAGQALFDPGTFRHLDTIGIAAGMRCLEIGGGGGSVAHWMGERVTPSGSVLVTDIDTSGLVGCDLPNIEVRVHNICTDPLEVGSFDLIHARLVLEHLPPRLAVLDKLVTALRPSGWMLLEDFDFSGWIYLPEERLLCEPKAVHATVQRGFAVAGAGTWDAEFGRDLPLHLLNAGLDDVGGEVCTPIITGGSPQSDFVTLSAREAGPLVVDAGYVSRSDWDDMIAAFEQPGAIMAGFQMVSAWGRRPR
jgi:SAM-dependent methyltransferase